MSRMFSDHGFSLLWGRAACISILPTPGSARPARTTRGIFDHLQRSGLNRRRSAPENAMTGPDERGVGEMRRGVGVGDASAPRGPDGHFHRWVIGLAVGGALAAWA